MITNPTEMAIDMIKGNLQKLNSSSGIKFPCSICYKTVLANQKAIECDACSLWCHIKCDGTTIDLYKQIMENNELTWHCLVCKIRFQHENIPFTLFNDTELENINNSESMKFCNELPKFEIISEVSKFSELDNNDIDHNLPNQTSNKYYSVGELQKIKMSKIFNIFHSNGNGIEYKMDLLHEFLSSTSSDFDVVAITETSQGNNDSFKSNVAIKGYDNYFIASLSARGGVAIYSKDKLNSFERTDLSIQNKEFESVWIEIKNNNSKNIICGCLCRHPRYDLSEFLHYLEN